MRISATSNLANTNASKKYLWCRSQAWINEEDCGRKGIRRKTVCLIIMQIVNSKSNIKLAILKKLHVVIYSILLTKNEIMNLMLVRSFWGFSFISFPICRYLHRNKITVRSLQHGDSLCVFESTRSVFKFSRCLAAALFEKALCDNFLSTVVSTCISKLYSNLYLKKY